ncbi:STAS domain-containing protein [Streptomyces sp. TLI_171]|uniref:STAS domain-containing protein n=1 Tax=Streptomyces sp. TLI_171 TaxID=1938859 RepID=UPI000C199137|nr:STAS domain-containing protein [Streptomyces sp. TLI_171]RKE23510.1 anti-anti-sigma factor [Streptomyces sp. TLI_171]
MAEQPAPREQLTATVTVHATVAHLHLSGELDMDTVPDVEAAVRTAFLGHPRIIIIEASALSFCDCAGLGALLRASRRITDTGGVFHLENPSPRLVRLAALTGTSAALGLAAPLSPPRQEPRVDAPAIGAGR